MPRQPLYPHVPGKKEPLFPHTSRGRVEKLMPSKEPWQMTRSEYTYSENSPKIEAIQEAIKSGKRVVLATAYRATELTKPEHIRIKDNGDVQIPRGNKWDTLTAGQVDSLAQQAGYPVPDFGERVYHHVEVERAISEGKPVPPEVLADYPELAKAEYLPSIDLLASTEGDPIRKFCCRICGECAPEELLEEGKFPERIAWLRQHYEGKHPGMWGKMSPMTIDVGEPVSPEYHHLTSWVDEPLPKDAY